MWRDLRRLWYNLGDVRWGLVVVVVGAVLAILIVLTAPGDDSLMIPEPAGQRSPTPTPSVMLPVGPSDAP